MQKTLDSFQYCLDILKIKCPKNLTPQAKSDIIFRAACKVLRLDPKVLPIVKGLTKRYASGQITLYKLGVIRDAVVGKWKINWDSYSELKWYPWHWMNKPGF